MGGRSVAARQAAQARAERMAAIAAREDEIERCLTRFLQACAEQEEVLATARARCAAVMERATARAGTARADANEQVARLTGLIKDRDEVADRTGLSLREVRAALREAEAQQLPPQAETSPEPGCVTAEALPQRAAGRPSGDGGAGATGDVRGESGDAATISTDSDVLGVRAVGERSPVAGATEHGAA